ncbi:MAG: SpoIIE family protein phosphatase [Coriobacteriia bacterium]|nr:SpoIIE family protein phosphatase [Coriobacteriia bacterium]
MRPAVFSHDSLAARYTRIAATLAIATTLLLGAASALGVYRVVKTEQQARVGAYRDILRLEVSSHLQAAYRTVRSLADRKDLASASAQQSRFLLGVTLLDNGAYIDHLTLAERNGELIASYPASGTPSPSEVAAWWDRLQDEGRRFAWVSERSALWLVTRVSDQAGVGRLLAARVRTERIAATLGQIASTPRAPVAFIRDERGRAVLAAGAPAVVETATLEVAEPHGGVARARGAVGTVAYEGFAASVDGVPGLRWEVVVMEPSTTALRETSSALQPAVIAYLAVLLLAVVVAAIAFSWLVRPLQALEARARAAAQGVGLEPLAVDRGDEVGRLLESFNLVALRLNRLQEAVRLLARTDSVQAVSDNVVRSVIHLIGLCDAGVFLAEGGNPKRLRLAAASGASDDAVGAVVSFDAFGSANAEGFPETRTVRGGLHRFLGSEARADDDSSVTLVVPLKTSGGLVGVLAVSRTEERPFSPAEAELLSTFAAQAAVALEKAGLFERQTEARVEAEALQRAAELLVEEQDTVRALAGVAKILSDSLGLTWSLTWVDQAVVLGRRASAAPEEVRDLIAIVDDRSALEGGSAAAGTVTLAADDADEHVRDWLRARGLGSIVVAYARQTGRVTGLLAVGSQTDTRGVTERQRRVVEAAGRQVALALERSRLFREAEERAASLETMFRVSQAVSSSLQVNVVLGRVLDVVQKILNADAVMLMRWEPETKRLAVPMGRGALDRSMLEMRFSPGEDLPGAVLQTQQVMLVSDLERTGGAFSRSALKRGLHSAVLVPLVARGRAIGVLATLGLEAGRFDKSDADLLSTFAAHAALAIDTANLFSREHEVSRVLQSSILPASLPMLPGVLLASAYAPAGSAAQIGGDYYDAFLAPDGRVVLVIADVCGKGVEAATKTSMIRFTVRGMVTAGAGARQILEALNGMVAESEDPADIFTVWLGMLDTTTGVLRWSDGGHPPGLLRRGSSGTIVRLGPTGPLVGAASEVMYEEQCVTLEPGDRLVLYTDGVSEARHEGRMFGEGRIRRVLRRASDVNRVAEELMDALERFTGGERKDDVAVLVAEFVGQPSLAGPVPGNTESHGGTD